MNLFHWSVKNIHTSEIWLWDSIYKIDSFAGLTIPSISYHLVIARAESPWRSTGDQYANRTYPNASIVCSGLPRRSLAFLPRNDKCVLYCTQTAHWIHFHALSSRGRSRWRSNGNQ